MNHDDWMYLYGQADAVYRRGKFVQGLDREDFRQECALAAVKYTDKIVKSSNVAALLYSIVRFTARKYYRRTNKPKQKQISMEVQVPSYVVEEFEDLHAANDFTTIEQHINTEQLLENIKKYLQPLENVILMSIYNGMDYQTVGESLGIGKGRISQHLKAIQTKLKEVHYI